MSPEQARGLEVDARTDIFSLGVVVYEMIAGRHPFEAETSTDVLAAILTSEPEQVTTYAAGAPAELDRVIKKAIEKDAARRYQRMDEMVSDLKSVRSGSEVAPKPAFKRSAEYRLSRSTVTRIAVALIPLLAVLTIGRLLFGGKDRLGALDVTSLKVDHVTEWKTEPGDNTIAGRFSPDSKMIAFSSNRGGGPKIWIKQLIAQDAMQVTTGDSVDRTPVWSPDGQRIAFVSNLGGHAGIWVIPALDGSSPKLLKNLDTHQPSLKTFDNPDCSLLKHWSQDGQKLYFELSRNLFVLTLASGDIEKLTGCPEKGVPPGFAISPDEERIAYVDEMAEQVDVWVMPIGGAPLRVTHDKESDLGPVWHPDGKRLIYTSIRGEVYQVCVADLEGSLPQQITFRDRECLVSDISSDGTQILYSTSQDGSDIWSAQANGSGEVELTSLAGEEFWPEANPSGSDIAFQGTGPSNNRISRCTIMKITGNTGRVSQVAENGFDARWSPDGKMVAFVRSIEGVANIWAVSPFGGDERQVTSEGVSFVDYRLLPYTRLSNTGYSWTPDRRIAYYSRKSGSVAIYLTAIDGSDEVTVATAGNDVLQLGTPAWSPHGSRMAYVSCEQEPGQEKVWSLWVYAEGASTPVFQSRDFLQLIGWSLSGDQILLGRIDADHYRTNSVLDIKLQSISIEGEITDVMSLDATREDIRLSQDTTLIAFASRRDGADNIWVVRTAGGAPRRITANTDRRLYIAGLAWSADGKSVYFGKQWRQSLISVIRNFK
jgi:Tol biopolymer transport system component